jgi:hypothetical protein
MLDIMVNHWLHGVYNHLLQKNHIISAHYYVDILDIVVTLLKIVLNNKSYYIGTLLCRYPLYSCYIAKDSVKQQRGYLHNNVPI